MLYVVFWRVFLNVVLYFEQVLLELVYLLQQLHLEILHGVDQRSVVYELLKITTLVMVLHFHTYVQVYTVAYIHTYNITHALKHVYQHSVTYLFIYVFLFIYLINDTYNTVAQCRDQVHTNRISTRYAQHTILIILF